ESAFGGDWAGGDGVETDAARAPFDGETAGEGLHAGFGNGRGDDVSGAGAGGAVGGDDIEDGGGMFGGEPATSASHGHVDGAHKDDAEDGVPGARGEIFGAGEEVAGCVVDEDVERAFPPDAFYELFDGLLIADVAAEAVDVAAEGRAGGLEDFFAASANVDGGAELEIALGHGAAESGAAAGDESAFSGQKRGREHGESSWEISRVAEREMIAAMKGIRGSGMGGSRGRSRLTAGKGKRTVSLSK